MTEEKLDNGQNLESDSEFPTSYTTSPDDKNYQSSRSNAVNIKVEYEEKDPAEENAVLMTEYVVCNSVKTEASDCIDGKSLTSSNAVGDLPQPPETGKFNAIAVEQIKKEQTVADDVNEFIINDDTSVEVATPNDPLHVKDNSDYEFAAVLCPYCKMNLEDSEYLEFHMMHFHQKSSRSEPVNVFKIYMNKDGDYECATCPYKTKEKYRFEQHLEGHDEAKRFQCEICYRLFKFARNLKTHLQYNHVDDWPYRCDKCPYKAKRKWYLQAHIGVHQRNKFQCDQCYKHFVSEDNLKDHRLAQHTGERPFKCDLCSYHSKDKSTLQKHRSIHGKYTDQCEVCFKFFVSVQRLQEHQYTHSGVKPFSCEKCSYRARKLDHLKQHRRVHNDERTFRCPTCANYFKSPVTLKKHQLTHNVDKPYNCDRCAYKARTLAALKLHLNAHDLVKRFQCPICHSYYKSADGMRKHRQIHSDERPYGCQKCSYTAKRMDCLRQHYRVHVKEGGAEEPQTVE